MKTVFSWQDYYCYYKRWTHQKEELPDLLPEICLCRCMKLPTACEICKASIYEYLSPWESVRECLTYKNWGFLVFVFRWGAAQNVSCCVFLAEQRWRPSGNCSRAEDLISYTSVWKQAVQAMLSTVLHAVPSVTTDLVLWKNKVVFTERDMLKKDQENLNDNGLLGLNFLAICFTNYSVTFCEHRFLSSATCDEDSFQCKQWGWSHTHKLCDDSTSKLAQALFPRGKEETIEKPHTSNLNAFQTISKHKCKCMWLASQHQPGSNNTLRRPVVT